MSGNSQQRQADALLIASSLAAWHQSLESMQQRHPESCPTPVAAFYQYPDRIALATLDCVAAALAHAAPDSATQHRIHQALEMHQRCLLTTVHRLCTHHAEAWARRNATLGRVVRDAILAHAEHLLHRFPAESAASEPPPCHSRRMGS